ncbi:MAG: hypothetical protein PUB34_07770 [Clostridia bacterium]|nr:hypothetical protein [Clostridia bacterium]
MTYKDCQRKIIIIRNIGGDVFEQAYFILKDKNADASESDIVKEANRIVSEAIKRNELINNSEPKKRVSFSKRKHNQRMLWFFLGAMLGSSFVFLFMELIR